MTDTVSPEQRWSDWVTQTSAVLGVDPALVDIPAILRLSKQVAHRLERPLVPVSAYLLGLAVAGSGADSRQRDALMARLLDTLPKEEPN